MIRVTYCANGNFNHFAWRLGEEFMAGVVPEGVQCIEADGEEAAMLGETYCTSDRAQMLYARLLAHWRPLQKRGYELIVLEAAADTLTCSMENSVFGDTGAVESAIADVEQHVRALRQGLEKDWRKPLTQAA